MYRKLSSRVATDQPELAGLEDYKLVSAMRLILASSALVIIAIDPAEPDRFVTVTYAVLVLYTVYSAWLYLTASEKTSLHPFRLRAHLIDIGWYAVLISLSSGTNSVFFFGFFFPILVASFRWGFASGLRVTVGSAIIFAAVGYSTTPPGPAFELNRFLLRPTSLLVLGFMISRLGGFEVELNRRLTLLKEITRLSNPRLGVDWTIGAILERLVVFYRAQACLLVLASTTADTHTFELRRAVAGNPGSGRQPTPLEPEMAHRMLSVEADKSVLYVGKKSLRRRIAAALGLPDIAGAKMIATVESESRYRTLAALLDAEFFISVPLRYHHQSSGRLFVTAEHGFNSSDVEFLRQVAEHIKPVIDNIRLLDHLASEAAEEERRRIARDIHDSVVQPYIGLQMGLASVQQRLSNGDNNVRGEIAGLLELTCGGISELRGYISGLKDARLGESSLVPAIRRFTAKFAEATGIKVDVEAGTGIQLHDRLAAEILQMVTEGLSNVRRHTQSNRVSISLASSESHLRLRIENERDVNSTFEPFAPRSIEGRAEALGGSVSVKPGPEGQTIVLVEIPF